MDALAELKKHDREILLLNHSIDILRWDQETYMPERAIEERAEQVALLQGMVHDRIVDPRQEELFGALGMSEKTKMGPSGVDDETRGFLRETFRRYTKQVKTPKTLVEELAKVLNKDVSRRLMGSAASVRSSPRPSRMARKRSEKLLGPVPGDW